MSDTGLVAPGFSLIWAVQTGQSSVGPIGVALGVWVIIAPVQELWARTRNARARMAALRRVPLADWGKSTAHLGFGVVMIAISSITAWEVEDITILPPGESHAVAGVTITLRDVRQQRGENYLTTMAVVDIARNGRVLGRVNPERRFYPVARMPTTEAGILNGLWRDIYVVIGEPQDGGGWVVRTFIKPMANWIWGGAFLMALGGALSLLDRRYRSARNIGARKAVVG